MSWMRYLTLATFRRLNPNWEMVLYTEKQQRPCPTRPPWSTPERQDFLAPKRPSCTGFFVTDYGTPERLAALRVRQVAIDFNWPGAANPVYRCDLTRWMALGYIGGFFSDMDIVFVRPMDDVLRCVNRGGASGAAAADGVICFQGHEPAIGFAAAKNGGSRFYLDVLAAAKRSVAAGYTEYQVAGTVAIEAAIGCRLKRGDMQRAYPVECDCAESLSLAHYLTGIVGRRYRERFLSLSMATVYPWRWTQTREIFDRCHRELPGDCVGIHWFAGAKQSQNANGLTTEDNWTGFAENTLLYHAKRVMGVEGGEAEGGSGESGESELPTAAAEMAVAP